jgi:hypothetical protein
MAKIAPTIRAGLMALGLMLGATASSGEAPGSQAIAGSRDPAPSANVTSVAARASCSFNRVCLWTGPNFTGRKTEVRPVPSGQCRESAIPPATSRRPWPTGHSRSSACGNSNSAAGAAGATPLSPRAGS